MPYLFTVQTPLVCLEHDVSFSRDVQAGALDLLDAVRIALVLVCRDDLLHFLWSDLVEVSRLLSRCNRSRALCDPAMMALTVKPADDAHTLFPSALKMAALSILPVPTRLSHR